MIPMGLLIAVGTNGFVNFIVFVFYYVNPMFTLYDTCFTILCHYFNNILIDGINVPKVLGADPTIGYSLGMYAV